MSDSLRRAALVGLGMVALGILPALADYQAGLDAFKKGDLKRALEEFQQEIQKHPNYDYGHFMLGLCYLKQKQYPQAVASLSKAAELDKEKLVYHTNLAQAYTEQKQWQNVVKALEGKVQLRAEPNVSAQAYLLLGVGYLNIKQPEKAAEQLELARKVTPNDFRILSPLGVAHYLRGDYDAAISALSAANKIDPKHAQTTQYLGEAYLAKAQRETDKQKKQMLYQSATKFAEENLRLSGDKDFDSVNLVARAYLGADKFQEAVAAFERAIALKADHGYAHFNRGEAYKGLKDWVSAEKEYARAAELMPSNGDVLATLAYAYEQLAKQDQGASLDKALAAYQKSNSLKPKPSTKEAIARVQQNIQIRAENQTISAENQKIEEENARRRAEYEAKVKEAEEYEKRRKQYLEDKGLVEKGKPAQQQPAEGASPPPQGSQN
jgi:tetratricopeptide (TPR) repeat protein